MTYCQHTWATYVTKMRATRRRLVACVCVLVLVIFLYRIRMRTTSTFGSSSRTSPNGADDGQNPALKKPPTDPKKSSANAHHGSDDHNDPADDTMRFLLPDGGGGGAAAAAVGLNDFLGDDNNVNQLDDLAAVGNRKAEGPQLDHNEAGEKNLPVKMFDWNVAAGRVVLETLSEADALLNEALKKGVGRRPGGVEAAILKNEDGGPVMNLDALKKHGGFQDLNPVPKKAKRPSV